MTDAELKHDILSLLKTSPCTLKEVIRAYPAIHEDRISSMLLRLQVDGNISYMYRVGLFKLEAAWT